MDEHEVNEFELVERHDDFSHPYARIPLENGKIPILEQKDSADGLRYSLQDRGGTESSNGIADSGLAKLRKRPLTTKEIRELYAQPHRSHEITPKKVDDEVRAALAENAEISVLVLLEEPERIHIKTELNREVAMGTIGSWADYYNRRDELKALDLADIATHVKDATTKARAMGIEITYECEGMYCFQALVTKASLSALERQEGIAKISTFGPNNANQVDGRDLIIGQQVQQFLPQNGGSVTTRGQQVHDGENFPPTKDYVDLRLAIIDIGLPNDEHPGFREGTGSSIRIEDFWDCNVSPCTQFASAPGAMEGNHATQVLGQAIGDVRDEQDGAPNVPNGLVPEQQRSGMAGEAKAHAYRAGWNSAGTVRSIDKIVSRTGTQPSIVLSSIGVGGNGTGDPDCSGDHAFDVTANNLFEDDKLFVFAAGNDPDGDGSLQNCVVDAPGAAASVFVVGSRGGGGDDSTATAVRSADITDGFTAGSRSAFGGDPNCSFWVCNEAQRRSIVDLAGYGCRRFLYDLQNGYSGTACGTSQAAPVVAGSLLDFIDFYINQGWTDIRVEPGYVFANGLLAGDRRQSNGSPTQTYRNTGFHARWGAGAPEFRRFDNSGMDGPWGYHSGSVCVDHQQVVSIPLNNGVALSNDVEDFKGVAWWYDDRHELTGVYDNVDLRLRDTTSGAILRQDTNWPDSKARIYHDAVGGKSLSFEIVGTFVGNDTSWNCGANSIRVYYAFFYEDSDRDDSNGPANSEIQREGEL